MTYKEPNLTAVLTEVFGAGYVDIMTNNKKANDQHILNCKLACIKSIMSDRKAMGREPDANFFDKLYDFDLYNLQMLELEYRDLHFYYQQKQRP